MWGFAQAAQEWKKAREEKKVFSSLRLTLFLAFLQEWQQHLEKMAQPEAQEGAIKLGAAQRNAQDQSLEWIYQRWNPEQKALEPVPGADPVNHRRILPGETVTGYSR